MSIPAGIAEVLGHHEAGIDRLRFYDLRHTAVASTIAQGAHVKSIQMRMGHSSAQVTLDRYGQLFPELDAQIVEGLDVVFRGHLALIRRAADDTAMTRVTQECHEIGANRGPTAVSCGQTEN